MKRSIVFLAIVLFLSILGLAPSAQAQAPCIWSASHPCAPATPATGATPFPDTGSFLQNFFIPPVFNRVGKETNSSTRIVFATDPTHPCDQTNNNSSWVTASFGYQIEWSPQTAADVFSNQYYGMISNAPDASIITPCLLTFNYRIFQIINRQTLLSLHLTPYGQYDQVTPHIWYAPSNLNPWQIKSVDVSNIAAGTSLVADLSSAGTCPNIQGSLTVTTNGEITRSYGTGGVNVGRFSYWGNGAMDNAINTWIYDPINGCMWINWSTGDINAAAGWGLPTTCTACVPVGYRTGGANLSLHRSYIDADGKTVWAENQNFTAGPIVFTIPGPGGSWPSGASMFTECDIASPVDCGNHKTFYPGGFMVNGAGNTGAGSNQRVADTVRPVSNPGSGSSCGSSCLPVTGYEDLLTNFNVGVIPLGNASHDSSAGADSSLHNYFFEGTYMNASGTGHVTNAWQQELDLVIPDPSNQNRSRLMATHLKAQLGSLTAGLAGGASGISCTVGGVCSVTTMGPHGFSGGNTNINAYNCSPSSLNSSTITIATAPTTTTFTYSGGPASVTGDCMFDNPATGAQDFYATFLPNGSTDNRLASVPENSERSLAGDPFRGGNCAGSVCPSLQMLIVDAANAQNFYVDAGYTGGSDAGTMQNPWTSLSDTGAWAALNAALQLGDAYVFFSATQPGSGSAAVSTTQIDLSQCTAANCLTLGNNVLHLDGQSMKNAGTATVPAWTTNLILPVACVEPTPSDTNPPTYTCPQNTNPRFTIQASVPITGPTGPSAPNNCVYNFDIEGFSFQSNGGQSANLTYVGGLTFLDNEATRIAVGSNGPGVYIGPGQNGPCHQGAARPAGTDSGPDNVTLKWNLIHDCWGECLYSGASTSDPFINGAPAQSQQVEGGSVSGTNLSCGNGCGAGNPSCTTASAVNASTCSTGANYVIQGNTLFGCAAWGGQGDGMDIKDGHTNLSLLGNQLYSTRFPNCAPTCTNLVCYGGTAAGTACTNNTPCTGGGRCGAGADGRGMIIESLGLADGNFIKAPDHDGVDLGDSWNTSTGRAAAQISNTIIADVNSGIGHQYGAELESLNVSGLSPWGNVSWFSNSMYNIGNNSGNTGACFLMNAGGASGTVLTENNICQLSTLSGSFGIGTHDYNDYFQASGLPSGEGAHSITTDPKYVSTSTPYVDVNFKLQSTSAARAAGLNLFPTVSGDYFGNTRPNSAFDLGASQFQIPSSAGAAFQALRELGLVR